MNEVEEDIKGAGQDEREEEAEPGQIGIALRTVKFGLQFTFEQNGMLLGTY